MCCASRSCSTTRASPSPGPASISRTNSNPRVARMVYPSPSRVPPTTSRKSVRACTRFWASSRSAGSKGRSGPSEPALSLSKGAPLEVLYFLLSRPRTSANKRLSSRPEAARVWPPDWRDLRFHLSAHPAIIATSLRRIELQLLDRRAARLGSFLKGSFQQSRILYLPAAQQLLDSQNLDTRIRPRVERRLVFIEASFGGLFQHGLGRLLHRDQHPDGGLLALDHPAQIAHVGDVDVLPGLHRKDNLLRLAAIIHVEVETPVDATVRASSLFHRTHVDQANAH